MGGVFPPNVCSVYPPWYFLLNKEQYPGKIEEEGRNMPSPHCGLFGTAEWKALLHLFDCRKQQLYMQRIGELQGRFWLKSHRRIRHVISANFSALSCRYDDVWCSITRQPLHLFSCASHPKRAISLNLIFVKEISDRTTSFFRIETSPEWVKMNRLPPPLKPTGIKLSTSESA